MKDRAPFRAVSVLVPALVMLACLPPASTSAATRREIVEEAFAAHAAGSTASGVADNLVASVEFEPQEARIIRLVIRRPHGGLAFGRETGSAGHS